MLCKILTSEEDLRQFALIGNAAYKVEIPYQYFTKGTTLGFFKGDRMVGGAAIITEGPFRAIEIIPKDQRSTCGIASIPADQIVEANAVWLLPEVTEIRDVVTFWFQIIRTLRATKRTWLVIPYNKSIDGLDRLYKPLGMRTLFSGAGSAISSHKNIRIGICPLRSIYKTFAIQAVKRIFRAVMMRRPARGEHAKTAPTTRQERTG